jgi:hypothetical protein
MGIFDFEVFVKPDEQMHVWETPFLEFYGEDMSDSFAKYVVLENQVKEMFLFELEDP